MADLSQVEQALVDLSTQALYPNGTGAASITGHLIKRGRGWPDAAGLESDLAALVSRVTVYSQSGTKNTTRSIQGWETGAQGPVTLTIAPVTGGITIGGVAGANQLVFVKVTGIGWALLPGPTDTPQIVAQALAAQITADGEVGVTVQGSTLLFTVGSTAIPASGAVSALAPSWKEVRRQEQLLRFSIWAPTYAMRDQIAQALDAFFADLRWFSVGDPKPAWIEYRETSSLDVAENSSLYRRDMVFKVEYGTYLTSVSAPLQMVVGRLRAGGAIVRFAGASPAAGVVLDANGNVMLDSAGQIIIQPT